MAKNGVLECSARVWKYRGGRVAADRGLIIIIRTLQCAGKVGERRRRGKEMMREYGKGNPVTNSLG